jgi:nicotinamide-nucleotide amidase
MGIKTAEILSTGDELVGGRGVDTNSAYIAGHLGTVGIEVVRVTTVGDHAERLEEAWREALKRADLVISTGGLGPTVDDLTTVVLARAAGLGIVRDQRQAERIEAFFARLGRVMPENNLDQADLPQGATAIDNRLGTAPGYRLEVRLDGGTPAVAVALPGVPREMKAMLAEDVLPWLAGLADPACIESYNTFQTFGMSESAIDEALAEIVDGSDVHLSLRASFPSISVRVALPGNDPATAQRLEVLAGRVRQSLGDTIYAEGESNMETVVGQLLSKAGKTLATAESCTGGLIGDRITSVPGSSDYYKGGLVAYSDDLKEKALGVSASTLSMFGSVSEETAIEMALGMRRLAEADFGLATTGIAGPGGGSQEKPVGTVAVALASGDDEDSVDSRIYHLGGTRSWVKGLSAQIALDWMRRHLLGRPYETFRMMHTKD